MFPGKTRCYGRILGDCWFLGGSVLGVGVVLGTEWFLGERLLGVSTVLRTICHSIVVLLVTVIWQRSSGVRVT